MQLFEILKKFASVDFDIDILLSGKKKYKGVSDR